MRKVGREALESSSTVLQTVAKPSQLPTHQYIPPSVNWNKAATPHKKSPVSFVTPGFAFLCNDGSQMSQAQGIQTIRHENGESLKIASYAFKI